MTMLTPLPHRIRSFVLRQGRMTTAQTRALEELLPRYALPEGPLDLSALFGRDVRRTLEIGFGNGAALAELARRYPDEDFLGAEVHRPGVGHLLIALDAQQLGNVRVANEDAVQLLSERLPDAALDAVLIYFPDPWPKKRHHKRRLLQPEFAALLARKLKRGGRLQQAPTGRSTPTTPSRCSRPARNSRTPWPRAASCPGPRSAPPPVSSIGA